MNTRNAMAQCRSVQSRGAVIVANPTRLVQLALDQILIQMNVARGCMERIRVGREVRDACGTAQTLGSGGARRLRLIAFHG